MTFLLGCGEIFILDKLQFSSGCHPVQLWAIVAILFSSKSVAGAMQSSSVRSNQDDSFVQFWAIVQSLLPFSRILSNSLVLVAIKFSCKHHLVVQSLLPQSQEIYSLVCISFDQCVCNFCMPVGKVSIMEGHALKLTTLVISCLINNTSYMLSD